jgi:hypothetical protein
MLTCADLNRRKSLKLTYKGQWEVGGRGVRSDCHPVVCSKLKGTP